MGERQENIQNEMENSKVIKRSNSTPEEAEVLFTRDLEQYNQLLLRSQKLRGEILLYYCS